MINRVKLQVKRKEHLHFWLYCEGDPRVIGFLNQNIRFARTFEKAMQKTK